MIKIVVYYALLVLMAILTTFSDTPMRGATTVKELLARPRWIAGGIVVALLPMFWTWPLGSWWSVILIPTFGHAIASGLAMLPLSWIVRLASAARR